MVFHMKETEPNDDFDPDPAEAIRPRAFSPPNDMAKDLLDLEKGEYVSRTEIRRKAPISEPMGRDEVASSLNDPFVDVASNPRRPAPAAKKRVRFDGIESERSIQPSCSIGARKVHTREPIASTQKRKEEAELNMPRKSLDEPKEPSYQAYQRPSYAPSNVSRSSTSGDTVDPMTR